MDEKKMPAEQDARVMALLLRLTDGALDEFAAESLYNSIAARILRVPAEYQAALGMQVLEDAGAPLSPAQAERFVTCVLYCVCYTGEDGKPGFETVTYEAVEHWRGVFRPFFDQRHAALDGLIGALRAMGTPPGDTM